MLLADMSHKSLLTYKFPHPFLFGGGQLFVDDPGNLSCRVSHILDVASCDLVVLCNMLLYPLSSFKLLVRFGGLIRFKFTFKIEVKFTCREIHRSQMYCLPSLDKRIHSW